MAARTVPDRFKVAFSLAGEQRDLILPIAQELEAVLGPSSVFYDLWFEHWSAGQDADLLLQELYTQKADLVVVCVSRAYGDKPWTRTEYRAIRADSMALNSHEGRLRVLPLRVGDGEVPGVLFNDLVPDIRGKAAADAVELILARWNLVSGAVSAGADGSGWPGRPPELDWSMADHGEAREVLAAMICRDSATRIVSIQGASEAGKTHLSRELVRNLNALPGVRCGRFDFKGTSDVGIELEAFSLALDLDPPSAGTPTEGLGRVLTALRRRQEPTVLVLDTYEAAGAASEWVEKVLLPAVTRATWLRVVVVGQSVPRRVGTLWERVAAAPLVLRPPEPHDWHAYVRTHRDDLDLTFITQVYALAAGRASLLASLLGPGE